MHAATRQAMPTPQRRHPMPIRVRVAKTSLSRWLRGGLSLTAALALCGPAAAQEGAETDGQAFGGAQPLDVSGPQEMQDAQQSAVRPRPIGALPLPEDDHTTIPLNSVEKFSVAPYKLWGVPRAARGEVLTVRPLAPTGAIGELPDQFVVETMDLIGATEVVLPLFKEGGERFERRIEFLVVDQVSKAYEDYLRRQLRTIFPTATLDVSIANKQTAVISGYVDRAQLVEPIGEYVRGYLASATGINPSAVSVINTVHVVGAQTVQLKVVIAEVNRSKARDLGFDWQLMTNSAVVNSRPGFTGLDPLSSITNTFIGVSGDDNSFTGVLRALESNQLGKILAEPIVTCTSGEPAYFNVGGEFPFQVAGTLGTPQIEFKSFGTSVKFLATVLGGGRIRLDVRPEVSSIDPAIFVGGTPALTSRVVETTVDVENGQTFAIAGLVDQRVSSNTRKVPLLGDIPAVGSLFQFKSYFQEETELVIVVTPHLVQPLDEGICRYPGRESRIPNDAEWYLGSRFEPPCFADPYDRDRDLCPADRAVFKPDPVVPFDNYGRPEGMPMVPGQPVGPQYRGPERLPAGPLPAGPLPGGAMPGGAMPGGAMPGGAMDGLQPPMDGGVPTNSLPAGAMPMSQAPAMDRTPMAEPTLSMPSLPAQQTAEPALTERPAMPTPQPAAAMPAAAMPAAAMPAAAMPAAEMAAPPEIPAPATPAPAPTSQKPAPATQAPISAIPSLRPSRRGDLLMEPQPVTRGGAPQVLANRDRRSQSIGGGRPAATTGNDGGWFKPANRLPRTIR